MKLGNSLGQNTGKKYFKRSNYSESEITETNREKALCFSDWFVDNIQILTDQFKEKMYFDEDSLNDTFIRIYEKILYTGSEIKCFKSYFCRAYYTNYIQKQIHNDHITNKVDYSLSHNDFDWEGLDNLHRSLEKSILDYVYDKYTTIEYQIFKTWMMLKPSKINNEELGALLNLKASSIQRVISTIKKDISLNNDLVTKYTEIKSYTG